MWHKNLTLNWVPAAHAYNPSHSGARDQKDAVQNQPITKIGLVEWLKV
jgi:hypothetical protein